MIAGEAGKTAGGARRWIGLSRSRSPDDSGDGPQKNFKVQPERPFVNILQVHLHPLFEWNGTAAGNLPQAGNAGTNAKAATLPVLVEAFVVAHRQRPWADQAHVAHQNVEQL